MKRRKVWRASEQPPRHRMAVDVSARVTPAGSRLGITLGQLLGMRAADMRASLPPDRTQTEEYWREVWSV